MPRINLSHRSGNHCGSTTLRNLSTFYGWGFDESTCFGLAAGLGFTYRKLSAAPERLFFGRTPDLEREFFEILDLPYSRYEGDPFDVAWRAITEHIDGGDPVMIFTDLYYLDYYGTDTHFSPHSLLVVGYDDDRAYLADSEFDEVQTLPLDSFQKALTSDHMTPLQCRYQVVDEPTPGSDFETAATVAIEKMTRFMLESASSESVPGDGGIQGVEAIRAFADDVPSWDDLSDPSWTARFAYQNIERRGTGGGAFRSMYASFLEGAADRISIPGDAPSTMADISADWTDVAEVLYEASEADTTTELREYLRRASDDIGLIADREADLYRTLRSSLTDVRG